MTTVNWWRTRVVSTRCVDKYDVDKQGDDLEQHEEKILQHTFFPAGLEEVP